MPTPYFPQLNAAGLITQRPYRTGLQYSTSTIDMPCGQRQAWGWRGMGLSGFPAGPLGRWELQYPAINDSELLTLRLFYESMKGRYGEFTYLDPAGNLVPASEDFTDTSWTRQTLLSDGLSIDPFGGVRAQYWTGDAADSMLWSTVLPDGGASGYVLCGSVWAKAHSAGQQLAIGFVDYAFGLLGHTVHALPQAVWVRIQHTITLASSSDIRLRIGGVGTWGTTSVSLFGAQCVPMPGPGGYARTPGAPGLASRCRFDSDIFAPKYLGPNQHSLTLPIVETY